MGSELSHRRRWSAPRPTPHFVPTRRNLRAHTARLAQRRSARKAESTVGSTGVEAVSDTIIVPQREEVSVKVAKQKARPSDINFVDQRLADRTSTHAELALPATLVRAAERTVGATLDGVRVHPHYLDASAPEQALTKGHDVFFRPGAYAPETPTGQWLIQHELAHVAQSINVAGRIGSPRTLESEAYRIADAAMFGRRASVRFRAPYGLPMAYTDNDDADVGLRVPGWADVSFHLVDDSVVVYVPWQVLRREAGSDPERLREGQSPPQFRRPRLRTTSLVLHLEAWTGRRMESGPRQRLLADKTISLRERVEGEYTAKLSGRRLREWFGAAAWNEFASVRGRFYGSVLGGARRAEGEEQVTRPTPYESFFGLGREPEMPRLAKVPSEDDPIRTVVGARPVGGRDPGALLLVAPDPNAIAYRPDATVRSPVVLRNAHLEPLKDADGKRLLRLRAGSHVKVGNTKMHKGERWAHLVVRDAWVPMWALRAKPLRLPSSTPVQRLDEAYTTERGDFVKIRWQHGVHWVEAAKLEEFDLTYATKFGEERWEDRELTAGAPRGLIAQRGKQKNIRFERGKVAKQTFISADEAKKAGEIAGSLRVDTAIVDPETGRDLKPRRTLPMGTVVLFISRRRVGRRNLHEVELVASGDRYWLPSGRKQFKDLRRSELETEVTDPIERDRLRWYYQAAVTSLVETKQFTEKQDELIRAAQAFVDSFNEASVEPNWVLTIPEEKRREAGEELSPDLIRRMQAFYAFVGQQNLISGPLLAIGGIRARSVAHRLSVSWMFNRRSGVLDSGANRWKVAKELLEIGGRDQSTGVIWATESELAVLRQVLDGFNSYDEMYARAYPAGPEPVLVEPLPPPAVRPPQIELPTSLELREPTLGGPARPLNPNRYLYREFEMVFEQLRRRNGYQTAMAAEGYPSNSPLRSPNIRKTSVSRHCGGEAIDIFLPWKFNHYDPIIDAIAAVFGLHRPVKDSGRSPESWHYERIGVPMGEREPSLFDPKLVD